MKISIGHAKNEAFELIFGNVLIGIGGFLVGLTFLENELFFLIFPAFIIFGFGIIFDVRVLRKFAYDLKTIKEEINESKRNLSITTNELKQTKRDILGANKELSDTVRELQRIKLEVLQTQQNLESTEKRMKKAEEKIFGFSGQTFAKSSWANPIEKQIEEMNRKIQELERSTRDIERERRGF